MSTLILLVLKLMLASSDLVKSNRYLLGSSLSKILFNMLWILFSAISANLPSLTDLSSLLEGAFEVFFVLFVALVLLLFTVLVVVLFVVLLLDSFVLFVHELEFHFDFFYQKHFFVVWMLVLILCFFVV